MLSLSNLAHGLWAEERLNLELLIESCYCNTNRQKFPKFNPNSTEPCEKYSQYYELDSQLNQESLIAKLKLHPSGIRKFNSRRINLYDNRINNLENWSNHPQVDRASFF